MKKKLLIVEDEQDILELISAIFEDCGDYVILCAKDGEEALRIAREDNPDVILMDIKLPKINGYDVCRSIKSNPATSDSKILMMSGMVRGDGWHKAQEVGADGYITKPFTSIVLVEKVEEGNYAVLSIIRPERLNALQNQTLKEIAEALETVEIDQSVRCVVLRGVKEYTKKPAFSAGADLSARGSSKLDPENIRHRSHAMYLRHKYYDMIEEFPKPLIAAVDGFALGGGLELVLVCDLVIASKRSQFGFPEINNCENWSNIKEEKRKNIMKNLYFR